VNELTRHVADFWAALDAGGEVVAAVSGGPDSVALLHALCRLHRGGSLKRIIVGHVNHQLRGADSDGDEAFVARLADALRKDGLKVEYRGARLAVAGQRGNLEANARRVRYEWLAETARSAGVRWVATGHTADDQAETVLHRLLRGSGLRGLCGIPRRRPLGEGVEVVRPLLGVRRTMVLAFLTENGLSFRQDSSNVDQKYTRNRLRHELLPHLAEQYNPAIVDVLNRLARQADEVLRGEEEEAKRLLAAAELQRAGAMLVFDRRRLAAVPRNRVREMFRLLWRRERWPTGEMGFEDWQRLTAVALGEAAAVDLPHGVTARCRENVVQLSRRHP
jgi:tRNA(Ile)-lysidine synthase